MKDYEQTPLEREVFAEMARLNNTEPEGDLQDLYPQRPAIYLPLLRRQIPPAAGGYLPSGQAAGTGRGDPLRVRGSGYLPAGGNSHLAASHCQRRARVPSLRPHPSSGIAVAESSYYAPLHCPSIAWQAVLPLCHGNRRLGVPAGHGVPCVAEARQQPKSQRFVPSGRLPKPEKALPCGYCRQQLNASCGAPQPEGDHPQRHSGD